MMNGSKPYSPSGGKRTPCPMRTGCVLRAFPSPSPRPSPLGRGRIAVRPSTNLAPSDVPKHRKRFPLSSRERAGVRGNRTQVNAARRTTPGTVKLWESPRRSRGFPARPNDQSAEDLVARLWSFGFGTSSFFRASFPRCGIIRHSRSGE